MNKKYIAIIACISTSLTFFIAIHYLKKSKPLEIKEEIVIKEEKTKEEKEEENKVKSEEKKEKEEEEEEVKPKEKEEKERATTPWQLTWIGKILSLETSFVASSLISLVICLYFEKKIKEMSNKSNDKNLSGKIISEQIFLLFLVFKVIISPLLFALKKFEKKSYWKRFLDMLSFIDIIFVTIAFLIFYAMFQQEKNKKKILEEIFICRSGESQEKYDIDKKIITFLTIFLLSGSSAFTFFYFTEKKEEDKKIPWQLTWKGEAIFLGTSIVSTFFTNFILFSVKDSMATTTPIDDDKDKYPLHAFF